MCPFIPSPIENLENRNIFPWGINNLLELSQAMVLRKLELGGAGLNESGEGVTRVFSETSSIKSCVRELMC